MRWDTFIECPAGALQAAVPRPSRACRPRDGRRRHSCERRLRPRRPGIPERLLPKIFQPFFTTKGTTKKGEQKGTGLGLAICKDIIEHHKGRIEVESTVGKGTTFSILLPMAKPNRAASAA